MPFKDTKDGQTHSFNDGCGEPEHNSGTESKPWSCEKHKGYGTAGTRCSECFKEECGI